MEAAKKLTDTGLSSPETVERYAEFRKLLLHRRNEVLRRSDAERAILDEQVLTSPGDVGDASVIDTSSDYFLKLADNDRRELLEIRDAFTRMQRGTFGICENCQDDIPIERLEKLPYARRCIDCQSMLEGRSRAARLGPVAKL